MSQLSTTDPSLKPDGDTRLSRGAMRLLVAAVLAASPLAGCGDDDAGAKADAAVDDGGGDGDDIDGGVAEMQRRPPPFELPEEFVHGAGDVAAGQEVFRFETFGNEAFWTQAMQLPQGLAAAQITPLQALQLGLSVNADALHPDTAAAMLDALGMVQAGTPPEDTAFGDPAVTLALINQNAVIGVVNVGPDGTRAPLGSSADFADDPSAAPDFGGGEQVGLSCAGCHARTDESVLPASPDTLGTFGSIGSQVDGPTAHDLDVGTILAAANNSLAYYPMLQVAFESLGGASIGRGDFPGLVVTEAQVADPSTIDVAALEAQADAYLTGTASSAAQGARFYPVGQFDAFPDGLGNPLHITPFFATEQGAPWGIDGAVALLEDFNNTVFTVSFDPTSVATDDGRALLEAQAGAAGLELVDDYRAVLEATGVTGFPFVNADDSPPPGQPSSIAGRRVDSTALLDLNAYMDSLPSPRAPEDVDQVLADRGREVFMTLAPVGGNCTSCHQVDPNKFVNPDVIPFADMYPAYEESLVVIADRMDLAPIQNSGGPTNLEGPNPFFDDRMIILDGSRRGEPKGTSFPLLMDLVGRRALLHDDSVRPAGPGATFEDAAMLLLDPARGQDAAHPFYVAEPGDRAAVVEFLRSRETIRDPETDESQVDQP